MLAHARALLTSAPQGRTAYIQADLREPEKILASPVVSEVLDFSQPVALMLVAILHFIADAEDPQGILATLLAALPPGSYLAATHASPEDDPAGVHAMERTYRAAGMTLQTRTASELGGLAFSGLELIPRAWSWSPSGDPIRPAPAPGRRRSGVYGAVARKPAATS